MEQAVMQQSRSIPWWKRLGAGLVTGAADDDPSGIATYSQVGAAYGYGMLWTVLLALPLMIGIQAVSARVGRVTGAGLAKNLRSEFPVPLVAGAVILLAIANVINLSADIGAIGAAAKLLAGGPAPLYAALAAILSVLLQVFIPLERYSPVLKILTLSLLAYLVTVAVLHVPWLTVAKETVWPTITMKADYAVAIVAVLGTTISPYLFFWQSSQEANEIKTTTHRKPLKKAPRQAPRAMKRIYIDTVVGMLFSEVVAFCIILVAAAVLHAHGKTNVQTSADAAMALRPLAGKFAFLLFATGIIGTGLLAIPVLAGSVAFALGETFNWRTGLEQKPARAKLFYGAIVAATIGGMVLSFTPMDPIKMLFWSAVINGVVAVPLMVLIMLLASRRKTMGKFPIPLWLKYLGWAATAAMGAATAVMIVTSFITRH
ncbi:MAG TPA: Nramp family divalent metal transporter [Rhodanobacteraceae bacterium]|nr:Nramp family divalent metal transporter [Rhodanobacteraceae bacterium]